MAAWREALASLPDRRRPSGGPSGVRAVLEQAFDRVEVADAESIEQVGEVANGDSPTW